MFGRKKEKPRRDHSGKNLSQYGLFDIPTNFDTGLDNAHQEDEDDSDLEAELAALSGGGGSNSRPKKPAKKVIPQGELDAMIADSLKDVPSDEELSVDENDPELLGELGELTGDVEEAAPQESSELCPSGQSSVVDILNDRLKNYEAAEQQAKSAGETSKARRYGRALKTLKDLIKQAKSGKDINLNDDTIPPEIHVGPKKPTADSNQTEDVPVSLPTRPAPKIPSPIEPTPLPEAVKEQVEEKKREIDGELLNMLVERQTEYKVAALKCKKSGDSKTAIKYVKIAKQFDGVIEAVRSGQAVDLSKMPGPPGDSSSPSEAKVEESESQRNTIPEIPVPPEAMDLPAETLVMASTVLEALEQRLAVYKEHEAQAKEQGNSSKARRYGRIVKQYEQVIKSHKAGKPISVDELPTPPGYGPIPVEGVAAAPQAPPPAPKENTSEVPASPGTSSQSDETKKSPGSRVSGNHVTTSHADKQVLILLAKQKQFKQAALTAKKQGELSEAKEFLKQAKGFDKLIEAARAGLPVDWSSIPVSPEAKSQLDNEYDIVMKEECSDDNNPDVEILSRLENQLQKQLKMCLTTRDHNKALGDVAGTNRFERLALNVTKDLDFIRMAKRLDETKVPKFHYEMKDFSIVKSFTDLMDNDMELTIVRGINYQSTNPKEIDTYVKFEFPFPQEEPYSNKTSVIKDTNNPEYNQTFVIPIQRSSRQCQRVFKRHGIKFEVYSKGGLFRSDSLIGTVNLKLQPLETQCELHDSFDLLEGRRKVGGKLEVQIRLRNPIVTQQVEQIQEKWLIIDQ